MASHSSQPATPNTAWTTEVRDACLRRMRLSKKEDRLTFDQWMDWLETNTNASAATKQGMALLIQRLLARKDPSTLVGDLVHVYYSCFPGQRDWTVGLCAQGLMEGLLNAEDIPDMVENPAETQQALAECQKQSHEAASFFYSFWTVWDKVGMAFLGGDAEGGGASANAVDETGTKKDASEKDASAAAEKPPASTTAASAPESTSSDSKPAVTEKEEKGTATPSSEAEVVQTATTAPEPAPAAPAPPDTRTPPPSSPSALPDEDEDESKASKHDILILAWKMACLVKSGDLVGPTAALALLLAMAHLNKDEEPMQIDEEKSHGETTTAAKVDQTSEPPTKKPRQETEETKEEPNAIPSPESDRFLPWLIETIQKPRPITRPTALGPPIPAMQTKNAQTLSVELIQQAIHQLLDDLVAEWTKDEEAPERNLTGSWMKDICRHIQAHGKRHARVNLRSLTEELPVLLTARCRRLVQTDFCNPTNLMTYYLETGNDPALAMYEQAPRTGLFVKKDQNKGEAKLLMEQALQENNMFTAMKLAVAEAQKLEEPTKTKTATNVTPTILTEIMELTEWTVSLLCLDHVKPSRKLIKYLRAGSTSQSWSKFIFPILNRALLRLSNEGISDKRSRTAPVSISGDPGMVQIHGDVTPDKQLGKAIIALYFHALEAVLAVESVRLGSTAHPQIVECEVFHRSLLTCCCWCVTKAIGVTQKLRATPSLQALQIYATLQICESNPYDFLKVSDSFVRALTSEIARGKLGSPLIFALPRVLQKDLQQVELNVADSLLWARTKTQEGNLPSHIDDFREKTEDGDVTLWPTEVLAPSLREEVEDQTEPLDVTYPSAEHEDCAEYKCVNFLIRKVVKTAFYRLESLCRFLNVPAEIPIATQAWVAFRYLLRNHVGLFFDRHVDHWILCCLYGVSKTLKYNQPELTFARIIEAYVVVRGPAMGDVTCQRIVRHIIIDEDFNKPNNIIVLYNRVFVPTMKRHLLGSKSLKRCAAELPEQLNNLQTG